MPAARGGGGGGGGGSHLGTLSWEGGSHLQGCTDSRSGGGRWGWGSKVMVLCKWSVLMSSYICSGVSGLPFCRGGGTLVDAIQLTCRPPYLIVAKEPEAWRVIEVVVGDVEVIGPGSDHAPFG